MFKAKSMRSGPTVSFFGSSAEPRLGALESMEPKNASRHRLGWCGCHDPVPCFLRCVGRGFPPNRLPKPASAAKRRFDVAFPNGHWASEQFWCASKWGGCLDAPFETHQNGQPPKMARPLCRVLIGCSAESLIGCFCLVEVGQPGIGPQVLVHVSICQGKPFLVTYV